MNKAKLKSYAPQARKDFIAAVTARANLLGLSEKAGKLEVAASQPQGDATVIAGQAWPVKVHSQRQQLIVRIQKDGFAQTMEAVAYTWFNRFAALRYMELHDYLGHGHRALSSLEGTLPDILTHAADLAQNGADNGGLPGLKPALVVEMKLAGNRDGELYRLLLVAQCNALSNVMPFLFERIDDETELLLPDNLLRTDSVIAKLVAAIDEEDWKEVEIIGWLYQLYISEKKDEVIGKVVKSEDIPAATQLFTPKWIVQYLVQNSVGRLWLMANPASALKAQWPYYISPADQSPKVQAHLDALIQARIDEDGDSLNPESITLLDPACGSGHILVEAYEVFKAIYLERGYQPRSIPRLILEKNLYGLDIDDRAAQMAGFALLMKARADDRRLFNEPIRLNVLSLRESKGLDADELTRALRTVGVSASPQIVDSAAASGFGVDDLFPGTRPQFSVGESRAAYLVGDPVQAAITALIATFAYAKTFGSLIQIPQALNAQLAAMEERLQLALHNGDLYAKAAANDLSPLVAQARVMGMLFDTVVANPPYMGSSYFNKQLKTELSKNYKTKRSDLYAIFLERSFLFLEPSGLISMITRQDWMFTRSYSELRTALCEKNTLEVLLQLGAGAFEMMSGEVTQTAAFSFWRSALPGHQSLFIDCTEQKRDKHLYFASAPRYQRAFSEFPARLESPLLYNLSNQELSALSTPAALGDKFTLREGIHTGDNSKFVRTWWEVSYGAMKTNTRSIEDLDKSGKRWIPYNKGGTTRKWFWGSDFVILFDKTAREAMQSLSGHVRPSQNLYFLEGGTWSDVATKGFGVRYFPEGYLFDGAGPVIVANEIYRALGLMNSAPFVRLAQDVMPNLHFKCGTLQLMPYIEPADSVSVEARAKEAVSISMSFSKFIEEQLTFSVCGLNQMAVKGQSIESAFSLLLTYANEGNDRLKCIERQNGMAYAHAFGLEDVKDWDILPSGDYFVQERTEQAVRLISYAIGCMMGRYNLDEPGLIYANSGNVGFDDSRYTSFSADADGIVPLTDELWFEDEAASRIREFLLSVWGAETLAENMAWLAESLGTKAGETPDETIRRYLAAKFYKDHLQTYKKRPIYWLFSSGKQGAFQALVYLHRYHEGTLSRMRAEYVVPLTGKIQTRIDMLEKDAAAASSTAARNKLAKEIEKLKKKHVELLAYDEQLRHHADTRITLDLDDGVKVNYNKFGNLLAEVKAVTGGASDD